MFFVIKKNNIIVFTLIIVFSCMTFFVWNDRHNQEHVTTFAIPTVNRVVVIDAGHGGIDRGASDNNAIEKEINLSVALMLQEFIEESGGVAILTRSEDKSTHDPNRASTLTQKKSDLIERKKKMDEENADIFISIHMNKFEQSKYRGAQVFYNSSVKESKVLAGSIQQSIAETLKDDNSRTIKPAGNDIFVLKDTKIPAVLVECGFLSNPEEAMLLKTEEYQRKIAWGIYMGIVKYFSGR